MRVRFADFVFDSRQHRLTRGSEDVPLSPKAFALFEALLDSRPAAVSKEALYERLWPGTFVEAGNLHNLVSEVRAAVGHDAIRTVHRVGYAFAAEAHGEEPSAFGIEMGGEPIRLAAGTNILGRDPEARVVIDAPDVSRQHARIAVQGEEASIEDLGSKNGTFVGGKRVEEPTPLRDGDEITLGRTRLVFRKLRRPATTI